METSEDIDKYYLRTSKLIELLQSAVSLYGDLPVKINLDGDWNEPSMREKLPPPPETRIYKEDGFIEIFAGV